MSNIVGGGGWGRGEGLKTLVHDCRCWSRSLFAGVMMESMVPLSNSFIWLNAADFQILYSIMTIKTSIHISLHSYAVPYPRVARHRVVH